MAACEHEKDIEWIERVRNEGSLPLLELDNCSDGWAIPPGDRFMVRGNDYFNDKVKIPSGKYLLKPVGLDWLKGGQTKVCDVLRNPNNRIMKAVSSATTESSSVKPFIWAFNLQVPSKDHYSAILYFVNLEPVKEGSLMDQFIKGDDAFRNSRLKLIAHIAKGPWIVRTAVGEQAICVIGRAVACRYFKGDNYIEVDVDIGSSVVANAIVHLAFGYVTSLTVDLAFLIESQKKEELPERLLGAVRFSELQPSSASNYESQCDDDISKSSFRPSIPLWRSFGSLLHAGTHNSDATAIPTTHANGDTHEKDQDQDEDEDVYEDGDEVEDEDVFEDAKS